MDTETSRDTNDVQSLLAQANAALAPLTPFLDLVAQAKADLVPPYLIQVNGGTLSEDEFKQLQDCIAGKVSGPVVFDHQPGRSIKITPLYGPPPELKNLSAFGGPWCDVEAQRLTYYRCEPGMTHDIAVDLIDAHNPAVAVHVVSARVPGAPIERCVYGTELHTIQPGDSLLGLRLDMAIIDVAAITTEKHRDWLAVDVAGRIRATGRVVALIEVDPPPPGLVPGA